MAEPQYWEVVGGKEGGGIVVRQGKELSSQQLDGRLATGALVQQVALVGERLHYLKVRGDGPKSGWVSRKLKDKELLVKAEAPAAAPAASPAAISVASSAVVVDAASSSGAPVPRPTPVPESRKLRVLCLHGTAGSPAVLKTQFRPLMAKSGEDIEFIFHAGHLICSEDDPVIGGQVKLMQKFFPPPFMQYAIPKRGDGTSDGRLEDPSTWRTYEELDECLKFTQEFMLKEAPIDAILGFSQGSNIATCLLAQAALGLGANVHCVVHMCTSLPGWKELHPHLYEQPIARPALIIRGEKDPVVSGSDKIAEMYVPEMCKQKSHSDTHKPFPGAAEAQALVEEIRTFLFQHCR